MKLTNKTRLILFGIVVAIQLAIPMQMINQQESTLSEGIAYKFKTKPIDPNDPFRGKYITLAFEIDKIQTTDSIWQKKENIYVYLEEDNSNFAKLHSISKTKKSIPNSYVKAKVNYYNKISKVLHFNLPFNRFYMEESKAKPAEDAYRKIQRDSIPQSVYALVYINEGNTVLKNVYIDDIPIDTYIMNNKNNN